MVITSFSVFLTMFGKVGRNSIKNTVAEKGDDRGVLEHPRETGL